MMLKYLSLLLIFLLSLAASVAVPLYLSGHLNTEAFDAVFNPEKYAKEQAMQQQEAKSSGPALGTLAQQLNARENDLDARKIALDEREKQLLQRENDLDKARADLEAMQTSINQSFDAATEDRKARLKTIAITLEGMEAQSAAKTLETMPTDEAAEILVSVKDKTRGEILEAMSTETAARIIKEMRDSRPGS